MKHLKPENVPLALHLYLISFKWRHRERDGVSNPQPHDCLLNRLFRCRPKKTSKLRVTGLCVGISQVTCEFAAQRVSNAENVSILMTSSWLWQRQDTASVWITIPNSHIITIGKYRFRNAMNLDIIHHDTMTLKIFLTCITSPTLRRIPLTEGQQ